MRDIDIWNEAATILDIPLERVEDMRKKRQIRQLYDLIYTTRAAKMRRLDDEIDHYSTDPTSGENIEKYTKNLRDFVKGQYFPEIIMQSPRYLDTWEKLHKVMFDYASVQGAAATLFYLLVAEIVSDYEEKEKRIDDEKINNLRQLKASYNMSHDKLLDLVSNLKIQITNIEAAMKIDVPKDTPLTDDKKDDKPSKQQDGKDNGDDNPGTQTIEEMEKDLAKKGMKLDIVNYGKDDQAGTTP